MATKRTRRARNHRDGISSTAWAALSDAEECPEDGNRFEFLDWTYPIDGGEKLKAIWLAHRDDVLVEWIAERPGTRPSYFWRFDAPEQRRRLGGVGTPNHERLAHVPQFAFGLPTGWITVQDVEVYKLIGRPLDVPAFDPANPPTYEAQAAYLDRHGLLTHGERRRLTSADFEPEAVEV